VTILICDQQALGGNFEHSVLIPAGCGNEHSMLIPAGLIPLPKGFVLRDRAFNVHSRISRDKRGAGGSI
jgi:hypothetical protein